SHTSRRAVSSDLPFDQGQRLRGVHLPELDLFGPVREMPFQKEQMFGLRHHDDPVRPFEFVGRYRCLAGGHGSSVNSPRQCLILPRALASSLPASLPTPAANSSVVIQFFQCVEEIVLTRPTESALLSAAGTGP